MGIYHLNTFAHFSWIYTEHFPFIYKDFCYLIPIKKGRLYTLHHYIPAYRWFWWCVKSHPTPSRQVRRTSQPNFQIAFHCAHRLWRRTARLWRVPFGCQLKNGLFGRAVLDSFDETKKKHQTEFINPNPNTFLWALTMMGGFIALTCMSIDAQAFETVCFADFGIPIW